MLQARPSRLTPPLVGFATLVALVAIWELADDIGWVNPLVAPAPSAIAASFAMLFGDEGLALRFLQTFGEALAAAGLSVVIGVPIGWFLHSNRWAASAYETWIASLAAAPVVLLYPLFLVIFGRNAATIVAMSFCTGLPPVVLKTKEGLDGTRRVLINVGRGFGLTRAQLFWKIMLPAAVPTIGNGVRLGLIFSLISVVGVEFLINFGGMGELINDLAQRWEIPAMFGAIFFVVLTSVAFFFVTERIERWLNPR
jgi:NitT/TauT family transport system permease protein